MGSKYYSFLIKDLYLDSLLIKHYMRLLTKHVYLHNQGIKISIQILCELTEKYFCPRSKSIRKGKKAFLFFLDTWSDTWSNHLCLDPVLDWGVVLSASTAWQFKSFFKFLSGEAYRFWIHNAR